MCFLYNASVLYLFLLSHSLDAKALLTTALKVHKELKKMVVKRKKLQALKIERPLTVALESNLKCN